MQNKKNSNKQSESLDYLLNCDQQMQLSLLKNELIKSFSRKDKTMQH